MLQIQVKVFKKNSSLLLPGSGLYYSSSTSKAQTPENLHLGFIKTHIHTAEMDGILASASLMHTLLLKTRIGRGLPP